MANSKLKGGPRTKQYNKCLWNDKWRDKGKQGMTFSPPVQELVRIK